MKYSKEQKERVLALLMSKKPPNAKEIAEKEGVGVKTVYLWCNELKKSGKLMPDGTTSKWSSKDKFKAVVETAALNQEELSRYCREKGMYPDEIAQWRKACEDANDWDKAKTKEIKEKLSSEKAKVRKLTKEHNRKERALAEMAALLVLQKKANAIWGAEEE